MIITIIFVIFGIFGIILLANSLPGYFEREKRRKEWVISERAREKRNREKSLDLELKGN